MERLELTKYRFIEFIILCKYRLIEFLCYNISGISFYCNYERFYFKKYGRNNTN